jgi:hypothetical protein
MPWETELDYSPPQPTDAGSQPAGGGGGSGSVAGATQQPNLGGELDKSDPETKTGRPQEPMSGEIEFEDGSRLKMTGDSREFTDASGRTGVLEPGSTHWTDPESGDWMPEDFKPPATADYATRTFLDWTASDWQQYASDLQTTERKMRERGEPTDNIRRVYDSATATARRMQGID